MDKNALLYYQSARALKLPTVLVKQIDGFEIKLGKRRYYFRGVLTPFNHSSSISIASNKYCMNKVLSAAGFPMPNADAFSKEQFEKQKIESLIEHLNFPLVVKPTSETALGMDVICNITNVAQLTACMKERYQRHKFLSVEEFHSGLSSYRVLVFYNRVIGVVQRFSARVIGDGIHSINELISIKNISREKIQQTVTLGPIKLDEESIARLNRLKITPDTIPKDKETIVLCYTCNASRGGTMKSLGKEICAENARLLCRAANVLGLNFVGFDVECEDILIPIETSGGVIIEANYNPDISIHENPMAGIQTQVTKKMLGRLILRHPFSYLLELHKTKSGSFYIKFSLIAFIFYCMEIIKRV